MLITGSLRQLNVIRMCVRRVHQPQMNTEHNFEECRLTNWYYSTNTVHLTSSPLVNFRSRIYSCCCASCFNLCDVTVDNVRQWLLFAGVTLSIYFSILWTFNEFSFSCRRINLLMRVEWAGIEDIKAKCNYLFFGRWVRERDVCPPQSVKMNLQMDFMLVPSTKEVGRFLFSFCYSSPIFFFSWCVANPFRTFFFHPSEKHDDFK